MKQLLLMGIIIIYAFLYLVSSIINSNFNPLHWNTEGQLLVLISGTLISGFLLVAYKIILLNNQNK